MASQKLIPMGVPAQKAELEIIDSRTVSPHPCGIEVSLLTGGLDRHYTFGLAMALAASGVSLEVVGGDELDSPEMHATPGLKFLELRKSRARNLPFTKKAARILRYYAKLIRYAATAKPKLFHILWNSKFELFDRTFLMFYYKLLGKQIALTAHNINTRKRDSRDSWFNRLTLKIQYQLAARIFVHTEVMKKELAEDFGVSEEKISVIPYGINNAIPSAGITHAEARRRLGIQPAEKAILFFGTIAPYKGLDLLVSAFQRLAERDTDYRLVIAGTPKGTYSDYLPGIQRTIRGMKHPAAVIQRIGFIPDDEVEVYFKAADLLALPYREIFQSGILFLGYSFGLPVVASDVGAFRADIVEGETGFLCRPNDPGDLSSSIERYFGSELFVELENRRPTIQEYMTSRHSWDDVATITKGAYSELLAAGRLRQ
jgi:glycosyltransferase involved in cell wall biosynthesis